MCEREVSLKEDTLLKLNYWKERNPNVILVTSDPATGLNGITLRSPLLQQIKTCCREQIWTPSLFILEKKKKKSRLTSFRCHKQQAATDPTKAYFLGTESCIPTCYLSSPGFKVRAVKGHSHTPESHGMAGISMALRVPLAQLLSSRATQSRVHRATAR